MEGGRREEERGRREEERKDGEERRGGKGGGSGEKGKKGKKGEQCQLASVGTHTAVASETERGETSFYASENITSLI